MKTWLLTWNKECWPWDDSMYGYKELRRDIAQVGHAICKWSCGVNKSIQKGDRLFLIKLGNEPRGIVASGYAASGVFEGTHWDTEKEAQGVKARRIFVSFDAIKDFAAGDILSFEVLRGVSGTFKWSSQSSGVEIPPEVAVKLEQAWSAANQPTPATAEPAGESTAPKLLRIGDRFDRIVDVMNSCFGWHYKACMRGWYLLNEAKQTSAWFPKIADLSSGTPVPGDKWYGWCNTMSDDGEYIYMNNYADPQRLNKDAITCVEPHITFVKYSGDNQYTYVGVYTRTERDPILGWVHRRIAGDINIAEYL